MRPSRLQIAKADIVKTFTEGPAVLRLGDVSRVFDQQREFWRVAKSTTLNGFLRFMTESTDLREARFPFPHRELTGFVWGDVPVEEVLLGLLGAGHYSHYTAVRLHGLSEQVPKTLYLTREKQATQDNDLDPYSQEAIDLAFSRPPRVSQNMIDLPKSNLRVVLLESSAPLIGIVEGEVNMGEARPLKLRYTSLERTLIDIVVRPFYSGGVFEVAKAFERAKGTVSVNSLVALLKRMKLGYPYHQAIGFYLERAGYKSSLLELVDRIPKDRDFYLTHAMEAKSFNSRWRLYVPEGF